MFSPTKMQRFPFAMHSCNMHRMKDQISIPCFHVIRWTCFAFPWPIMKAKYVSGVSREILQYTKVQAEIMKIPYISHVERSETIWIIAKLSGSQIKSWVALSSLVRPVPSRPASVTSAFMPIYIDFEHWCQYLWYIWRMSGGIWWCLEHVWWCLEHVWWCLEHVWWC